MIVGPPLSNMLDYVLKILSKISKDGSPYCYRFIGASGGVIDDIAKEAVKRSGFIFRDNFKPIDQFAVELVSRYRPDLTYMDEAFSYAYVSDFLRGISDDSYFGKSIENPSFIHNFSSFASDVLENDVDLKDIEGGDERLTILLDIVRRYEEQKEKDGLFETVNAYKLVAGLDIPEGKEGDVLFVYGFSDLKPIHMKYFFPKLFTIYNAIYFALTYDEKREDLFKGSKEISLFLSHYSPEIKKFKTIKDEDMRSHIAIYAFSNEEKKRKGNFIEIMKFKDILDECKGVARMAKSLILKGEVSPKSISVVIKSPSTYGRELIKRFKEYGIPFHLNGFIDISASKIIRLIVLPFMTAISGYKADMLMSLVENGYIHIDDESSLRAFESIITRLNLDKDNLPMSFASRRKRWLLRLSEYIENLENLRRHSKYIDEEVDLTEIKRAIEDTKAAKEITHKIFEYIEEIGMDSNRRRNIKEYSHLFEKSAENLHDLLSSRLESDENNIEKSSLKEFFNAIWDLERALYKIGRTEMNPGDYSLYLKSILNYKTFKVQSEPKAGVEILDVLDARYTKSDHRFFVGFNESIYPSVRKNPLYQLNFDDRVGIYGNEPSPSMISFVEKRLRDDKLDFFLSLIQTRKKVFLSYAEADPSGKRLLPSNYIVDLDRCVSLQNVESSKLLSIPASRAEAKMVLMSTHDLKDLPSHYVEKFDIKGILDTIKRLHDIGNGRLAKKEHLEILKRRIEEEEDNTFSYSRLKRYKECPMRYFIEYVLMIKEPPRYEFGLTPLALGSIYHICLKEVFEYAKKKSYLPFTSVSDDKDKMEEIRKFLTNSVEKELRVFPHLPKSFLKIKKIDIVEKLWRFLTRMEFEPSKKARYNFIPTLFECPINALQITEDTETFKNTIKISGRIDRMDIGIDKNGEEVAKIIDYKRNSSSGDWEQLFLYSKIAKKATLLKDKKLVEAVFYGIEKGSKSGRGIEVNEEYDGDLSFKNSRAKLPFETYSAFLFYLDKMVSEIKSGNFREKADLWTCKNCPFSMACMKGERFEIGFHE